MDTGHNYINGKWIPGDDTIVVFENRENPSKIGSFTVGSNEMMDKAVKSAHRALPGWRKLPLLERIGYLKKVSKIMSDRSEELAELLSKEVSKGYSAALSEVLRSVEYIDYTLQQALFLDEVEVVEGSKFDASLTDVAVVERVPVGVVFAISPFNYPVNLAISKIVPALVSGNTVVFKPATSASLTGIALVKMFEEAGLPKGVINTAIGRGREIGDLLNRHPLVSYIHFTGSTEVGKHITNVAEFKGLNMELGGKDAALVLDDADIELAAKEIVAGAFGYSGQRCTGVKRVLVGKKIKGELVAAIQKEVEALKVGYPEENADITPVISEKSAERIKKFYDEAVASGAQSLFEYRQVGNLIHPIVLTNVDKKMKIAWEEPFGPILPIMEVNSVEEMIKTSNQSEYGLQASVFTRDETKAIAIAKELEVGTVHINKRTQRGPDNFPFLGIKSSGVGVQGIKDSIESMTRKLVIAKRAESAADILTMLKK